jgi:hypothetical protein
MVTFCRRNWYLLSAGAVVVLALAVFVIVWRHNSSEIRIQPTSEEEQITSTFSASEKQVAMRLAIPKRQKMISEELSESTDEYGEQNVATEQQYPRPHIAIQESAITGTEESSISEEDGLVLEMPFGKVKFDPPYWTVEFNPTLDELRRLDEIAEELKNPSIGDDERSALVAERESIIEIAQRPTKYISGVVISKNTDAEVPTDINWYQLYEENFPDDR